MSWTDQNELMRLGKKMLDATGTNNPSEKSMISTLASSTGVAYSVARDAYVKSFLDPLLQNKVRKSMNWLIHANFIPEFVNEDIPNVDLDESIDALDPASINPDGVPIPKRMFNIDTGNMEDWPSGQYAILSHCWKGQEITYPYITQIKENQKTKEEYEMVEDDSDDEARKFARFQAKKFKHLDSGKNDLELLQAQCTQDVQVQLKKINSILNRMRITCNVRDVLIRYTELKDAAWTEGSTRRSYNRKEKDLEMSKMANKVATKEEEVLVSPNDLDTLILGEPVVTSQIEVELQQQRHLLNQAEDRLRLAKLNADVLDQNPGLRSAIEDLLPILERRKSMNKIAGSMLEAKRILDSGLFSSNGRKRYLWNDTCCINKADANELNESLAMMGQWYNNADFCLVHVDTPSSTEWVSTLDEIEKPSEVANFDRFQDINNIKWASRGWTLQEIVLCKASYYVNNLWKPLSRGVEGLGPYYYHCSYLDQHIRDKDISNLPVGTRESLLDLGRLRSLMDTDEKIPFIAYPKCSEKGRRLIGILEYLGVYFPGKMNDDNSSAHIQNAISVAAYGIESRLSRGDPSGPRLGALFNTLGFEMLPTRSQTKSLIKLLIRELVNDSASDIQKDRRIIAGFTNVPPSDCCRGLRKSSHSAHDVLSLAAFRECTVPIDRVYSLMGVLSVKFAAFHAEGPTQALCRLLDEVIITTNDISIFNWAGKDLGSPIRGRSLYPSALAAFSPESVAGYFVSKRNTAMAKASKEKRYGLQVTASQLTILLRRTIDFVKKMSTIHEDVPIDLIRNILGFIKETSLHDLKTQITNLGKLVVYLEDTKQFEMYRKMIGNKKTTSTVAESSKAQSASNIASRFGIKAPQMPQLPQMPQISAPKIKVGGFGLYGRKSTPKEPEPTKEISPAAAPSPPPPVIEEQAGPETLVEEVTDWVSTQKNVNNVPEDLHDLFNKLKAPDLQASSSAQKKKTKHHTPVNENMICPNPIMLTTSGIEGVFDVQRVIITMTNSDSLRYQVKNAVSDNQKVEGHCTISTALSTISVNFSCTAGVLAKQLDVCDVVDRGLSETKAKKASAETTGQPPTGEENTSYYSKIASYSSGFMKQEPSADNDDKSEELDTSQASQDVVFGETEEQRRVCRMLGFVQETNINMIVGEWVLARFTGAGGAKWFLCLVELGSTHSFYGRRIATDEVDFRNVVPEAGLVGHWENYMRNKKTELCRIVTVLIHGRVARKLADEVAGPQKTESKTEKGDDSDDDEISTNKQKIIDFIVKRGSLLGADVVQTLTDMWGDRLDGMLSDTILQQVPKGLRAAIMNLNENEDLLPAMFLSGIKVHMF